MELLKGTSHIANLIHLCDGGKADAYVYGKSLQTIEAARECNGERDKKPASSQWQMMALLRTCVRRNDG